MKKYFNSTKGFTLIELLIVIAILGILATAVLSAINPVEQINRGRDTGTQSDAEQLLSAIQRFNAANGYFPWQTGASDTILWTGSSATAWTAVGVGLNPGTGNNQENGWTIDGAVYTAHTVGTWAAGNNVLDLLGSTVDDSQKELLSAFVARVTSVGYRTLYVYNSGGAGASTYVCFKPQSNQFLTKAQTRCTAFGTDLGDFPPNACVAGSPITDAICLP